MEKGKTKPMANDISSKNNIRRVSKTKVILYL